MSPNAQIGTPRASFQVGLTGDFFDSAGRLKYADIGLDRFTAQGAIEVIPFSEHRPEIEPVQLAETQAVIVLTPRVTASSLQQSDQLLAVSRFGVGYDGVDVAACTAADVVLLITSGAVDHSVAEATVGWLLALTHHMRIKDQLVREGRWEDRNRYMGTELRDRTLGIVGCGGIGKAVLRMVSGFRMATPLVYDPVLSAAAIQEYGGRAVSLEELLTQADFVSVHCPLNDQTRGMIGERELSQMKRSAYLINTARGGIIDEDALYRVLEERRIAGAALDCFCEEPVVRPPRWRTLDNVLLAPHSIAWTEELFRDIGRTACQGILDLARGQIPPGVVNRTVFDRPSFQAKWQRLQLRADR